MSKLGRYEDTCYVHTSTLKQARVHAFTRCNEDVLNWLLLPIRSYNGTGVMDDDQNRLHETATFMLTKLLLVLCFK